MSDLNTAQLARLRRFTQLQLVESWTVLPATEHESVRVQITTSGEDVATINRVHLDAYLTGLAHGSWIVTAARGRWARSVLSERGRMTAETAVALLLGVATGWLLLWAFGAVVLWIAGALAVSLLVCLFVGRAISIGQRRR